MVFPYMQQIITKPKDRIYIIGLIVIAVSLVFFCLPLLVQLPERHNGGFFVINFACTIGYFILLLTSGRLRKGRKGLIPLLIFLILFLISAWSLNREMTLFEDPVTWFSAVQVVLCVNYILFQYFGRLPRWAQYVMITLLGMAVVVFSYMALFLMPYTIMGVVLFFVLGISLHICVPLLFVLFSIKLARKVCRADKWLWRSFAGGAGAVVMAATVFVVQWAHVTQTINATYRQAGVTESNGLPQWIAAAQHTAHGYIMESALKADLVYSTSARDRMFKDELFWRMPGGRGWGTKKHDPLVMVATCFAGKPNLEQVDRIRMLEAIYDSRHQAQVRLWRDDDLLTEHVVSSVQIWPQFGLAYTEKVLTVTNTAPTNGWNDQQEAIYTFHLPEGAVVTALSLWIEGREEKGILTSKSKADSAYKTIVGWERRDPSLVHWQESNSVSVRVFPVVAGQSRRFKLGITTPLIRREGKLVYENSWFDGPAANKASEDVQVDFAHAPHDLVTPAVFSSIDRRRWKRSGKYEPDWNIQLNEQPLSTESFCFDGKIYTVHPYHPQRQAFDAQTIYLDINKSWTRAEFEMIYDLIKRKRVYVYNNGLQALQVDNKERLFEELHALQFSLFPLYAIKDPASALLISKSPIASPNLSDLADSHYMQQLKTFLATNVKVRLFNIGHQLSPYLKSLKEYRVFSYEQGSPGLLKELLRKKMFAQPAENDDQIIIDNAGLMIRQQDSTVAASAPDHLMRLFAYNHIMQKTGTGLLTDKPLEDLVVQEAVKASVVSPVSSLVVLETQEDYDRFGIQPVKNSLQNASLHSKGAVPEPHEWALIIIAVLVIVTVKRKPTLLKNKI